MKPDNHRLPSMQTSWLTYRHHPLQMVIGYRVWFLWCRALQVRCDGGDGGSQEVGDHGMGVKPALCGGSDEGGEDLLGVCAPPGAIAAANFGGLYPLLDKDRPVRYDLPMSKTGKGGPGKAHREGMTLIELLEMFPSEQSAVEWFESVVWPDGRCCGKCGSVATGKVPNAKPMPYWCSDCRSYFSVRTGTAIARSNVPMRKWAIAIYLELTSLKSISSMKLHRDLGVTQKTAWFMLHRIREAWAHDADRSETILGCDEETRPLGGYPNQIRAERYANGGPA